MGTAARDCHDSAENVQINGVINYCASHIITQIESVIARTRDAVSLKACNVLNVRTIRTSRTLSKWLNALRGSVKEHFTRRFSLKMTLV